MLPRRTGSRGYTARDNRRFVNAVCTVAISLLKSLPGRLAAVLADRGYDSDAIIRHCLENNSRPIIPPRINRKERRPYDRARYRLHHYVEHALLRLKA